MHVVTIDISGEDCEPIDSIAPDAAGLDAYAIDLGSVQLTINYAQMQSLYMQLRPWFDDTAINPTRDQADD